MVGNTYTFSDVAFGAASVDYYLDGNQDGVVDGGDTQIAAVAPSSNGTASTTYTLPAGYSPQNVLAVAVYNSPPGGSGATGLRSAAAAPVVETTGGAGSEPGGQPAFQGPIGGNPPVGAFPTFLFAGSPQPITATALDNPNTTALAYGAAASIPGSTAGDPTPVPPAVTNYGVSDANAAVPVYLGASLGSATTNANGIAVADGESVPVGFSQPECSQTAIANGNAFSSSTSGGLGSSSGSGTGLIQVSVGAIQTWTIGSSIGIGPNGQAATLPLNTPVVVTETIFIGGGGITQAYGAANSYGNGIVTTGGGAAITIIGDGRREGGGIFTNAGTQSVAGALIPLNTGTFTNGTYGATDTITFNTFVGAQVVLNYNFTLTVGAASAVSGLGSGLGLALGGFVLSSSASLL